MAGGNDEVAPAPLQQTAKPQQRRSPEVLVAGLPPDSTRESVSAVFSHYGSVMTCDVLPFPGMAGRIDRTAVLRMETAEEAEWLVQNLNGQVPATLDTPVSVRITGQGKTSSSSRAAPASQPAPAFNGVITPHRSVPGHLNAAAREEPVYTQQGPLGRAPLLQNPGSEPGGSEPWGTVKLWNEQKAFGFIIADEGGPDVFVHKSALPDGVAMLSRGQRVCFQADVSSGKPRAKVLFIEESDPPIDGAPCLAASGARRVGPASVASAAAVAAGQAGGGVPAAFQTREAAATARSTARALGIGRGPAESAEADASEDHWREETRPRSCNLLVTGLPNIASDDTVKLVFGQYGTVTHCLMIYKKDGEVGALLRMGCLQEAVWAVEKLSGNIPIGLESPVHVRYADTVPPGSGRRIVAEAPVSAMDAGVAPECELQQPHYGASSSTHALPQDRYSPYGANGLASPAPLTQLQPQFQ